MLSPVLGGLVSYALFGLIKKHILSYNDEAENRLKEIKRQKYENDRRHKEAFERLSEIQKISYTHAMTRDVQAYHDQDYESAEFESDYFKELARIEKQRCTAIGILASADHAREAIVAGVVLAARHAVRQKA